MDEEILLRTQNSLHSGTTGASWGLAYFPFKSQPSYVIRPCFVCCRVDKNSNLESHDSNCIRDGASLLCSGIFCGRCYAALSMATLPIDRLLCHLFGRFLPHPHSYAEKSIHQITQDISKDSENPTMPFWSVM